MSDRDGETPIANQTTPLQQPNTQTSYGTLTFRPSFPLPSRFSYSSRCPEGHSKSYATTPLPTSPAPSYLVPRSQRPISAYDTPLEDDREQAPDAKTNGIRVWYSSYTSIDWLHDSIKDSARFARLRRTTKVRLLLDKGLGWLIVSVVGFVTACVAFLVVRSEQWLFDLKEGYCDDAWYKAKRFCCFPHGLKSPPLLEIDATCPTWRTWSEVFGQQGTGGEIVDYLSWIVIALVLAGTSCLLTLSLSNSSTFTTRKESGALKPNFSDPGGSDNSNPSQRKVTYYAAGAGIPEIKTILSGFVIHGFLGGRVLFTKAVGLPLVVASGLSLGKEGPFVHIASCIGNIVSRMVHKYENNEAKRREILSAACAAGVSVAFGAPIGGTLFSLEEVSYYFPPKVMWRSFFCAMVTAITLKMLDPLGTGKVVLFQVTYDKDWRAFELFPFILLGVFGGVYGVCFCKLNFIWSKHVRQKTWLARHPLLEVLLITLVTVTLCFLNPYARMGGPELIYHLFSECQGNISVSSNLCLVDRSSAEQAWRVSQFLFMAMIMKGLLTVVTFGLKVPCGIFIPSLGVGACAGRILGIWIQWMQYREPHLGDISRSCEERGDCVIPGLYAMVGAAAALSGVTRTTVSLAVIMFELTDTLTYAVPVMLAVLVAKTVADVLDRKGIYDFVIGLNQLPFLNSKHEYLWGSLQIRDVMLEDADTIKLDENNTIMSLRDKLIALGRSGNDDGGFPILKKDFNEDGYRMVGYIGASELGHALTIIEDVDADKGIQFQEDYTHDMTASLHSTYPQNELFDFSIYMDQAPLTISSKSPMELLHQFFVKLGARYVVVTDSGGLYEGVIDKKTWLAFLNNLEEKS